MKRRKSDTLLRGAHIIELHPGDVLKVKITLGETAHNIGNVRQHDRNDSIVEVSGNALAVVHKLEGGDTCRHLWFARLQREEKHINRKGREERTIMHSSITIWGKLIKAITRAGIPQIHVPGGLDRVIAYDDERIVSASLDSRTGKNEFGWILPDKVVQEMLKFNNEWPGTDNVGSIWINQTGWVHTPKKCALELFAYDPSGLEPPQYRDEDQLLTLNHKIFQVLYNMKTGVVIRIYNITEDRRLKSVVYQVNPRIRELQLGRPVPANILEVIES